MQAIEFVRQRLFLSAAIAGVLAGSAVGLFLPIRASAGDGAALGPWAPYATMPLSRFSESEFGQVRSARIWGDHAGEGGSGRVEWHLTGIIADPAPAALVAVKGGKTVQQLNVEGQLPDGGEITEITGHSVRFTRSGCRYERSLYAAVDPAEEGDCNPGTTGAPTQIPER